MVPTEMLTSILEEPSSGSMSSRYSPRLYGSVIGTGRSTSSEANAARLPPQTLASMRISLESTSSFFCASPCTLSVPAPPSPSASAPLLTRVLIALQARAMVSSSSRRSALITFCCWRPTRNCVSVIRFMRALFYALSGEPSAAQEQRRDQREHRSHAERRGHRTGGERNEGLAAV